MGGTFKKNALYHVEAYPPFLPLKPSFFLKSWRISAWVLLFLFLVFSCENINNKTMTKELLEEKKMSESSKK
jgi:hypothetical protein